ncbi:transcriptional regulator GcvA [Lutibaculum baratangense]|uniref:LysR family regulatory protein n=1 Tax=Lutibaculum baratangense AMV1 TaxID=631454 RepID=V4R9H9_9HYPH|nr:transcriptional regulator GcvA [Lutibaculum baratangense]ESR22856.1 LysR family regulatory protein [Lutibaculum baratangense AMV1]
MASLRRRLPPLNALLTFEAAARHLNFTRAAEELLVTQAAVSRQVQHLEEHLGATLFERRHRQLELTGIGQRLARAVAIGFEHVAQAADEIVEERTRADVTVSSSVTFASYWLMSRIANYRANYPDVDLHLVATAKTRDITRSGIDLAIRYGRGEWPGLRAHYLFDNDIFPVCAPRFLAEHGPIDTLAALRKATRLHMVQFDRNWVTWPSWFAEFGIDEPGEEGGLSFDNYMLLIHACIRGEGVALCGGRLAEDLIARGDLVRPLKSAIRSDRAFYLLEPDGIPARPAVRHFRDWLLGEARRGNE